MRTAALALLVLFAVAPARGQELAERQAKARAAWESLSPERREAVLHNYARFQAMSPEEKDLIQRRYRQFLGLPEDKKKALLDAWKKIKSEPKPGPSEIKKASDRKEGKTRDMPSKQELREREKDRGENRRFERIERGANERRAPGHRR